MLNTRVSNFYKSFKENEKTNFLGFAELELCNEAGGAMYRVTSVGLYQRKDSNTFYLQFPNKQGKDGKWRDFIYPTSGEFRNEITEMVVAKAKELWDQQN